MIYRLPCVSIIPPLFLKKESFISSNIRKWTQTYKHITEEMKIILTTSSAPTQDIFNFHFNSNFQLFNEIKELHKKNIGFTINRHIVQNPNDTFIFTKNIPPNTFLFLNGNSFQIRQSLCNDIKIGDSKSYNFMLYDLLGNNTENDDFVSDVGAQFHKCIQLIIRHLNVHCNTLFKVDVDICERHEQFIYLLSYLFEDVTFSILECNKHFQFYIVCENFIVTHRRKYSIYKEINKFMDTISVTPQPYSIFDKYISDTFHSKFNNFLNIIIQQRLLNTHNLANYIHTNLNNGYTEDKILKKIIYFQEQKINNWNIKYSS